MRHRLREKKNGRSHVDIFLFLGLRLFLFCWKQTNSHVHPMGQLTNKRRSDGAPDPHGALKDVSRIRIRHYRNLYLNRPDPIVFIPLTVDTSGRLYEEFICLLFLYSHREGSGLNNELPEESDQFRFLRASCFANLKGAVGWVMNPMKGWNIHSTCLT